MGSAIGDTLPLALGIAISPIPIIAAILMLLSPKARGTSVGFLIGWVLGIVVAVVVFTLLSGLIPASDPNATKPIAGTIKIVLGALLLLLALRQWRSRPKNGEAAALPKWMGAIDSMTAGRGFVLAFILAAVNPKNRRRCRHRHRRAVGGFDDRRHRGVRARRVLLGRDPRDRIPGGRRRAPRPARLAARLARAEQRDGDGGAPAGDRRRARRQGDRELLRAAGDRPQCCNVVFSRMTTTPNSPVITAPVTQNSTGRPRMWKTR